MLHGNLALLVIAAESLDERVHATIDALSKNDVVDVIYLSLPESAETAELGVTICPRSGPAELVPVLASIFDVPSEDRYIDPNFPPTVIFASGDLPVADIEGAIERFATGRKSLLTGLRQVEESDTIVTPEGLIRAAFPRLVTEEPPRFVARDVRLAIGDYQELKALTEVAPVGQLGWVIR